MTGEGINARREPSIIKICGPSTEPLAARVRRLQAEARSLALEHCSALGEALRQTAALSAEIAAGGEAYPAGAREIARRLQEEAASQSMTLHAIIGRAQA